MGAQAVHPGELVVEFRRADGVAVRQVDRGDPHGARRASRRRLRDSAPARRPRRRAGRGAHPRAGAWTGWRRRYRPSGRGWRRCSRAPRPRARGKASSTHFSSCRQTTSGSALFTKVARWSSLCLMEFTFQVAIRIASLSLVRPMCFIGFSSSAGKLELAIIPTVARDARILPNPGSRPSTIIASASGPASGRSR